TVNRLVEQPDGKVLVGGSFSGLGGQTHANIGRLVSCKPDMFLSACCEPVGSSAGTFVLTWGVSWEVPPGALIDFTILVSTAGQDGPYSACYYTQDTSIRRHRFPAGPGTYYFMVIAHYSPCGGPVTTLLSPKVPVGPCSCPPLLPADIALVIDNSGSVGQATLTTLKNELTSILTEISQLTGGDFRLAIVTPDEIPYPGSFQ